jgi:hypothetical protein
MLYLAGLTDEEINKITHLNAMKHFAYDPFTWIPREQATVSGLRSRAIGWDVNVRSTRHLRPVSSGSTR